MEDFDLGIKQFMIEQAIQQLSIKLAMGWVCFALIICGGARVHKGLVKARVKVDGGMVDCSTVLGCGLVRASTLYKCASVDCIVGHHGMTPTSMSKFQPLLRPGSEKALVFGPKMIARMSCSRVASCVWLAIKNSSARPQPC
eukprot:1139547-Pelagomonas_calceolata.AAC.4